jgi:hypothetical protein
VPGRRAGSSALLGLRVGARQDLLAHRNEARQGELGLLSTEYWDKRSWTNVQIYVLGDGSMHIVDCRHTNRRTN